MANNKKITALPPLGATPATDDVLPIVDVSGTATTKKVTVANLVAAAPQGDLLASNNLSDLANAGTSRTNLGLGTAATSASTDFSSAFFSTVAETTTSRTLSDSDNGKVIVCTNSATITVTIPSSLTAGFNCKLVQGGSGLVGVVAGSGVTLSVIGGKNFTANQYQTVDLINYASNSYVLDSIALQTDPAAWSGNAHSLSFDGVDDGCSFSSTTFSGAKSISAWVKFSDVGSGVGIASIIGGINNPYLAWNPSNKYIYWQDGTTNARYKNYTGTIDTSTWFHVMAIDNSSGSVGNCTFYVNGNNLGTPAPTANSTNPGDFTVQYIGRSSFGQYFPGVIDEVAIWNSDQTSNVSSIYNGGSPDDLSSLSPLHWWRMGDFEGGASSSVKDQGNATTTIDLTVNGATASVDVP